MTELPADPAEDIVLFSEQCVFMRSIYLHGQILFERSSDADGERMRATAPVFFSDLNHIFIEYVTLQVCKITDPAFEIRKKVRRDNLTVAFLMEHYGLEENAAAVAIRGRLEAFREKVLPARNKLISHSDREAIKAGHSLGGASDKDWQEFWRDLQDIVCIIHEKALGSPFYLNDVAALSDVDGLLKALKHAQCFDRTVHEADAVLTHKLVEMAMKD